MSVRTCKPSSGKKAAKRNDVSRKILGLVREGYVAWRPEFQSVARGEPCAVIPFCYSQLARQHPNNMLVELDGEKVSYIAHTTINFMFTKDEGFNNNMYRHLTNQMKRSTLISEVSEKERTRFFRIIREKIVNRKESLKL